jgi:hypothetical protein
MNREIEMRVRDSACLFRDSFSKNRKNSCMKLEIAVILDAQARFRAVPTLEEFLRAHARALLPVAIECEHEGVARWPPA